MVEFQFRFTRYNNQTGRHRLSGWTSTHADELSRALKVAEAMLVGMRSADPDNRYTIYSIEHRGCHFNDGEGMSFTGAGIWETEAEFHERVVPKKN